MKQILKNIIKNFHTSPLPAFQRRSQSVPLDLDKILTITGPRRAGKTWFFFQIISDLEAIGVSREQCLYLNFEDERIELDNDYDQIISAYLELYPERKLHDIYLFFDEIQELPNWEKYVRRMYDTVTRKIFLTGSNARMLSKEIATALRGRTLTFEIMPLSFSEFLSFRGIDQSERYSTRNRARIQSSFNDYLVWGGFPELVNMDPHFKPDVLQEYLDVMLYRDLVERYGIRDVSVLKYLIKRLTGSFTKEFSVNKLYNDLKSRGLKISRNSIYLLMDQIMSIYMVTYIEKYDPAVVKRAMSNRKIYLFDNGFASAMHYAFHGDYGKLLENLVYNSLRKKKGEIFFLKNSYECDFILIPQSSPAPLLVQVTWELNQDNIKRETNGLLRAAKRFKGAEMLLLTGEAGFSEDMPSEIEMNTVMDWLLEQK